MVPLQLPDHGSEEVDVRRIGEIDPDFHGLGGRITITPFP